MGDTRLKIVLRDQYIKIIGICDVNSGKSFECLHCHVINIDDKESQLTFIALCSSLSL